VTNTMLSSMMCPTNEAASAEPTSRWFRCHLSNNSRYLWNRSASGSVRDRPRIAAAPGRSDSGARAVPDLARGAGGRRGTVHPPLLSNLEDVGHGPVQHEPRRQVQE